MSSSNVGGGVFDDAANSNADDCRLRCRSAATDRGASWRGMPPLAVGEKEEGIAAAWNAETTPATDEDPCLGYDDVDDGFLLVVVFVVVVQRIHDKSDDTKIALLVMMTMTMMMKAMMLLSLLRSSTIKVVVVVVAWWKRNQMNKMTMFVVAMDIFSGLF